MSSDVYIDLENDGERVWFRIGHLATMNYFWNFLSGIEGLEEKHPVVTKELVAELVSLSQEYEKQIPRSFELMKEGWVDQEDYWKPDEIPADMEPYLGWSWRSRVD